MKGYKNIEISHFKNFRWYNIKKNSRKEIEFLKKEFNFNKKDLENCLPPLQRPKILKYQDYIFMILLFPYYDKKRKEIKIAEIDFFIHNQYIITVHENKLPAIIEFAKTYSKSEKIESQFGIPTLNFLYRIVECLQSSCFPMLTHVGNDIDTIEERIFSGQEKENIRNILLIQRNIVNFRKAMQAQKNVLKKLVHYSALISEEVHLHVFFENLIEQAKDIWDLLENYKETITALYHTNESLVSFRLNEIMKTLTIFSVIVFPLTLFAAVFSMNVSGTPFERHPLGFWIVVLLMIVATVGMLVYFKRKDWI